MHRFQAVILDLDGVITRTAALHAQAWKRLFDDFLAHDETQAPFDIPSDYPEYIDGMPRLDGIRRFLKTRGIELPEGTPDDPPGKETVHGMGNRKNDLFHELLESEGIETFDDAIEQIRAWRRRGIKTAVVSSSRNCVRILETAGIEQLFDAKVDGVDAAELHLTGKPAPDLFLEAARRLGVEPGAAVVVEDALAGVEAGRAGGFGLVAGVARDEGGEALEAYGADVIVRSVSELEEILENNDG